jgi:hypothetical protein
MHACRTHEVQRNLPQTMTPMPAATPSSNIPEDEWDPECGHHVRVLVGISDLIPTVVQTCRSVVEALSDEDPTKAGI